MNEDTNEINRIANNIVNGSADPVAPPDEETDWVTPLDHVAYHGLAGDIVGKIAPNTEADPVAILVTFLTAFGNVIGKGPHFKVEKDEHPAKLFSVLVGETAKARKGTSWGHIKSLMREADPSFIDRVESGSSTGEGIIWRIRDPITEKKEIMVQEGKKQVGTGEFEEIITDPGIEDKRLLLVEAEFAKILRVQEREGNTLSVILRNAWDNEKLATLTKNNKAKAEDSHISIIGHITTDELTKYLSNVEIANGFGNRFMWFMVKRSKFLPHGSTNYDITTERNQLVDVLRYAHSVTHVSFDPVAQQLWESIYHDISTGKPGIVGAMLARSEAYIIRLATTYAILDKTNIINSNHLTAAIALWEYAEHSVAYIFSSPDASKHSRLIIDLLNNTPEGLTLTDIYRATGNTIKRNELTDAITRLEAVGKIVKITEDTGGIKPVTRIVKV